MTRFLLTNDDGIHSSGLALLRRALEPLGEVITVAPERNASAVARSITIDRPLRVVHTRFGHGYRGVSVDGTPVDCVRVAMLEAVGPRPDFIVAGVNLGANMGNDVTYSGTVGAVLEGLFYGLAGAAVSIETRTPRHLQTHAQLLTAIVAQLLRRPLPPGVMLNVNLPDRPAHALRGVQPTCLGGSSCHDRLVLHDDDGTHGEYRIVCEREPAEPGTASDFEAVERGYVSLTPLHFDLTSGAGLRALAAWPLHELTVAGSPATAE